MNSIFRHLDISGMQLNMNSTVVAVYRETTFRLILVGESIQVNQSSVNSKAYTHSIHQAVGYS